MSLNQLQREAIIALSPVQTFMVWNDAHRAAPRLIPTPPGIALVHHTDKTLDVLNLPTSAELLAAIGSLPIDHASLVVPLCRRSQPEAVGALETLIGHPLTRCAARGKARAPTDPRVRMGMLLKDGTEKRQRVASQSVASTDTRTITAVSPNPKKPGSASWARFELYIVGDKVMDAIAKGVTSGDIRWDLERQFIKLGA